ncbi:MAG: sugar ABC transporter substrate-binding protein [Spirochaetia bacterium]|nr:sugar ABC transporter substrate-binding protein [Spirochaetia bacterium]
MITRKVLCIALLIAAAISPLFAGGSQETAETGEPTSVVVCINESPWLPAFRDIAKQYAEETGITVDIRAFPFATMSERGLYAATSSESEFDVITMNESMAAKFYHDGLVAPIKQIQPGYVLDKEVMTYDGLNYWDQELKYPAMSGELYSFPVNGNIQLFYYRKDLYDAAGLSKPETWDDVVNAAKVIADPASNFYGYAVRGQKGHMALGWDFYPYLRGFGGDIFADAPKDFTVTMDTPEALAALSFYADLAHNYAPPGSSSIGQSEQIAMLAGGQLLQTIVVAGANAQMDDPKMSVVPGAIAYTVVPRPVGGVHASHTGVLSMGIPDNIDAARKKRAFDFLVWFTSQSVQQTFAEHGGVPIRTDAMNTKGEDSLRFLTAIQESADATVAYPRIAAWPRIDEVIESRLSEVVADITSPAEALALMQVEITDIVVDEGLL